MNRDLVLSAIAAAVLHGGLFFGIPKGKPPVKELVQVVILDPFPMPTMKEDPPEPSPPDPDNNADTKDIPADIVPRQADVPTIAGPTDITMPFIPTPAVEAPNMKQVPLNIAGPGDGIKRGGIFSPSDLDRIPRTRAQISPVYPFEAKKAGMTGTVHVEFTVDEQGRVSDPRIIDTPDRVFNEPTIAAVLKWRFEPGMRQGSPVRFRMIAPVVFSLND